MDCLAGHPERFGEPSTRPIRSIRSRPLDPEMPTAPRRHTGLFYRGQRLDVVDAVLAGGHGLVIARR